MYNLEELKNKWLLENIQLEVLASDEELLNFQTQNNVMLPFDLYQYFMALNGTGDDCDENIFQFYPIGQVKNVVDEFKDWVGIPNYSEIINTLTNCEEYFVFADYFIHVFSYAIKLLPVESTNNEVLIICGGKYKKIANSFMEFIDLNLNDSIELYFNER